MDYTVFKTKILTKSSIEVANASLFEILCSISPERIAAIARAGWLQGRVAKGREISQTTVPTAMPRSMAARV